MFAITRFRCIELLLHFTITRSGRSFYRRLRYIEVRLTVEVRRPTAYKFLTADIISYLRAIDVCKQPRRSSDGQESKTMASYRRLIILLSLNHLYDKHKHRL